MDLDELPSPRGRHHISARSISQPVADYLQEARVGRTLATFRRSSYLELEGRIIALVAAELRNGPLNIVLDVSPLYSFEAVPVGGVVTSTPGTITVDPHFTISVAGAPIWTPTIVPWTSRTGRLTENLTMSRTVLLSTAPSGSFAHALPGARPDHAGELDEALRARAGRAMTIVARGLHAQDPSTLLQGARQLAGLGSGLTPSGDDIMVGVLLALAVLPPREAPHLRVALLDAAAGRSPRISTAYLEAAARGEAAETWHHFIAALPVGDAGEVAAAVRNVLAVGETSGADMLAGFLLALDPA